MTDGNDRYLHQQLVESHGKHAYFLLAAAASGIALAVKQTETQRLSLLHVPLGAAVCCWGLSFYFGCRYLQRYQAALRANLGLSQVQSGTHPGVPAHPAYLRAAAEITRAAANDQAEVSSASGRWQFRLLVAGAVLYVAWHVLGMAARTPALAATLSIR